MRKQIIFYLIIIQCFVFTLSSVNAKDSNSSSNTHKINIIASPNWVHPKLRKNHKGYSKLKMQKQFSSIWQYSTNRQSGKIVGGGTTKYKDYKPFYHPSSKYKIKN